jgi:hypothetical protein
MRRREASIQPFGGHALIVALGLEQVQPLIDIGLASGIARGSK